MGEWQRLISEFAWWQIILFVLIGLMQVIFFIILIGSFFLAFTSLMRIIGKSGFPYEEPADEKLSWPQRMARRQNRAGVGFGLALTSPEFAKDWKRLGIGAAGFLSCLAVVFVFSLLGKA
ncbi:MAG TPA: hypothetical protein VL202_17455 [Pararhizobium sp.]|uniref:hypothetical protein n=1 Tax=Pararhizobium sp. TaxID=1977563 RepID=UPI002B7D899D|nr:hypothetical protein [Pararhizobium sp.]HTO32947.1 hypothetical protein [Pararhizobium sp.]